MLLQNEALLNAEAALNQADSENIIELCQVYLRLLNEFRDELYKFRGTPEINLNQTSSLDRESVEQTRKSIRAAVKSTTRQRNQTEFLLKSFTAISGFDVVKTFNQLEYKGFAGWELRSNQVRLKGSTGNELMTIEEAVRIAGLLRRKAYVTNKTIFYH